ncbi:MAG TPA: 5'/3'-nucleotidase SurE [Acidimicrobiales bacterium]|jgi:5'-nucleotidase|nr:5'/3'-nucleotidase SurE [Acidimicrobiales bacterium]
MRILITNDDGVFAPGIAALARGLASAFGEQDELFVVAPLTDHSGTGAAVGPVYERESIPYEAVEIPGLAGTHVYGIEGPPALAVILACIEGFGPRPDVVVSGINHGVNAGRSALHSGTVGATLTAAQFGIRGLAVSIAWGREPIPWETPVRLATGIVPALAVQPPGSVLNLNVPAVPPDALRGLRHGRLGSAGLIRSVRPESTPDPVAGPPIDPTTGAITLTLRGKGAGAERVAELAELDPESDAALIAAGWATVTPLVGVREDRSDGGCAALAAALASYAPVGSSRG